MRLNLACVLCVLILILLNGVASGQHVEIMSFNIRYDNPGDDENAWNKRKAQLLQYLKNETPDVLCTQEGLDNQIEYMNSGLVNCAYFGVGRNDGGNAGEFAAVFYDSTRFDLLESGTFWLSPTPNKPSVGWDASLPRICTYGKLFDKQSDTAFYLFNVHYDHLGVQAGEESSKLITERMLEMNPTGNPVVLAGDFNALYKENPIQLLLPYVDYGRDISRSFQGPEGTINAFGNAKKEKCIDFIFVSGFHVMSYRHIKVEYDTGKYLSDHRPVIAKCLFKAK